MSSAVLLCSVVGTLASQFPNSMSLGSALSLESIPSDAVCQQSTMPQYCPCDQYTFMQERCIDFGKEMKFRYNGDLESLILAAEFTKDCLHSYYKCVVVHSNRTETQTLESSLQLYPCERYAKYKTKYWFGQNDTSSIGTVVTQVLREGDRKLVLAKPVHPYDPIGPNEVEYLELYFKDIMRMNKKGEYSKAFHVLFALTTGHGERPKPIWRQITEGPMMSDCGSCDGFKCLGGQTSSTIFFSLLIVAACLLITIYKLCNRNKLLPKTVSRPGA